MLTIGQRRSDRTAPFVDPEVVFSSRDKKDDTLTAGSAEGSSREQFQDPTWRQHDDSDLRTKCLSRYKCVPAADLFYAWIWNVMVCSPRVTHAPRVITLCLPLYSTTSRICCFSVIQLPVFQLEARHWRSKANRVMTCTVWYGQSAVETHVCSTRREYRCTQQLV